MLPSRRLPNLCERLAPPHKTRRLRYTREPIAHRRKRRHYHRPGSTGPGDDFAGPCLEGHRLTPARILLAEPVRRISKHHHCILWARNLTEIPMVEGTSRPGNTGSRFAEP